MTVAQEFLTRKQMAKHLGERVRGKAYAELTLIEWEKNGYGPPVTRIGREVLYSLAAFETWLKDQQLRPADRTRAA